MKKNNTLRLFAAGVLSCSAILFTTPATHAATFLFSDVTNWIGPAAGPGISQAAVVIQWPGQSAWAWGFRWNSAETRNGRDLLLALAGVDPRFTITGSGFISDLRWDADLNGTPAFSFPGYNATTGQYLNYFVNNAQQPGNFSNGTAPTGAHVLPPLGSPYDEAGPGQWVSSNTGVLGRPVVDGSWDGWVYSDGSVLPGAPVNAPMPVPEPSAPLLILLAAGAMLRRRGQAMLHAAATVHFP
jgi:hypothetical protein